jgi:acetyl esterase
MIRSMNSPTMFRPVAMLVSVLACFIASGCANPPVSRLSPAEREEVIAIGKGIDASILASTLPDGLKSEVGAIEDIVVPSASGSIACRIYRPSKQASLGTVLFVHGGAWVAGSVDSHDNMARLLCSTSQANVVSIEYSRAPDAMYPTQLDEIRSVIRWLNREGSSAGLAARPLAVCGDSAGGNMSAVIARESASNSIALAVLINPVVDMTLSTIKDPEVRGFSEMMANAYLPKDADASHPSLSPLLSDVPANHPPTFIAIADSDAWRAEQDLYAEKLKAAGVKLEIFRAPTGHLGPDGAVANPNAVPTLTAAGLAIKAAFGG